MHTANYEILMKPKESARCHQTLSAQVESGDETTSIMATSTSVIGWLPQHLQININTQTSSTVVKWAQNWVWLHQSLADHLCLLLKI